MKDIDEMLRAARPTPKRELPSDFAARIVTEITTQPTLLKRSWLQEKFIMNHLPRSLMATLAILVITLIGGATYAVVTHRSLGELLNLTTGRTRAISPEEMQRKYTAYRNDRAAGKSNALETFENDTTAELAVKLRAAKGYDPVICSQNIPESVSFVDVDSTGSMTAVGHYGERTQRVSLRYDSNAGIFTDIVCPAADSADAATKMQQHYNDYVTMLGTSPETALDTFTSDFTTASLAAKLKQGGGYDPIVCAQNTPAMVSFSDVTSSSMIAINKFEGGDQRVRLTFDPVTQRFTDIVCAN